MSEIISRYQLDKEGFKEKIQTQTNLKIYLPNSCRGKDPLNKWNRREFITVLFAYYLLLLHKDSNIEVKATIDRGLFLKEDIVARKYLPINYLFGVWVDFKDLDEKGYPSLFEDEQKEISGIVLGSLSLVNHSCESSLVFKEQKSRV